MLRFAVFALALAGCVDAGVDTGVDVTNAPLIGVDGSQDASDRDCHVVLRELSRPWMGYAWETNGTSWVWAGTIEISEAAASEGLVPSLLYQYGSNPTWFETRATPSQAAATPGFARFDIRIDHDLPGPGMSGTAIARARIQALPMLRLAQGGRLFDHNRNPGDFDNYVMTSPDFAVARDDTVCAPPAGLERARLVFDGEWSERREGVLAPGGEMSIVYAPSRLAQCKKTQGNFQLWGITAHVLFAPGGQLLAGSVRDGQWTLPVPGDAERATIWFEATNTSGCRQWDSNLGANYVFDATRPPQWIGNARTLLSRDTSLDCSAGIPAGQGFRFDTWVRQRAATTKLCFEVYEPGLTDRDDPDLWQKLDVRVKWRGEGQTAWQTKPVDFDRRVGNNARYALGWRDLDIFRPYHCPEATTSPTPDGMYVEGRLEYIVVVNGAELRPEPGAAFVGTFIDYANDSWRAQNCP